MEKSCVVQCICKRYPSHPWCLTGLGQGAAGGEWKGETAGAGGTALGLLETTAPRLSLFY